MSEFVHLVPGSPEWHEHRTRYWNASDAPAMMGCSPHETRSQLLHRLYCLRNGLPVPEPDEATQRLFDEGHRTEALARPIAEALLDDELAVMRVVNGRYAASLDGRTLDGMHWECKRLNADIREALPTPDVVFKAAAVVLPMMYRVQIAHQHLCDENCEQTLFTGALFDEDGNPVDLRHCYVERDEALIAQVAAGWRQFEKDLEAYVPQEAPPVIVPAAQEHLPAVSVQVSGSLAVFSNLADLKPKLAEFIARIPKSPSTDQEFADVGAAGKRLREAQKAIEERVAGALASIKDVNELQRLGNELAEMARQAAIACEKAEASGKEQVKTREVEQRRRAVTEHITAAIKRTGPYFFGDTVPVDFGTAIKGLKTLASVRDKLDTALAQWKIAFDQAEARVVANLATLEAAGPDAQALFADRAQLVHRDPDAVQAIVAQRVAAEAQRLERIKTEAVAAAAAAPAPVQAAQQVAETARSGGGNSSGAPPLGTPAAPAAPSGEVVKLTDLCAMVGEGFSITADWARAKGINVRKTERTSEHRGALVVARADVPRLRAHVLAGLAMWDLEPAKVA